MYMSIVISYGKVATYYGICRANENGNDLPTHTLNLNFLMKSSWKIIKILALSACIIMHKMIGLIIKFN